MIIIARSALPSLCAILLSAFIAASARAEPAYRSADFLGELDSVTTTFKNRLAAAGFDNTLFNCGTCFNATPVSGHLVYDSSVAVPASGTVNVSSIFAIPGVANSVIYELNVGPLQFHFGDAGMTGGPRLQYRDGQFNGFVFAASFLSPNGTAVTFRAEGPAFRLHLNSSSTTNLFTGSFNTAFNPPHPPGAEFGLINDQVFAPIPEPQTYALLLAGLGLLGFAARRKRG